MGDGTDPIPLPVLYPNEVTCEELSRQLHYNLCSDEVIGVPCKLCLDRAVQIIQLSIFATRFEGRSSHACPSSLVLSARDNILESQKSNILSVVGLGLSKKNYGILAGWLRPEIPVNKGYEDWPAQWLLTDRTGSVPCVLLNPDVSLIGALVVVFRWNYTGSINEEFQVADVKNERRGKESLKLCKQRPWLEALSIFPLTEPTSAVPHIPRLQLQIQPLSETQLPSRPIEATSINLSGVISSVSPLLSLPQAGAKLQETGQNSKVYHGHRTNLSGGNHEQGKQPACGEKQASAQVGFIVQLDPIEDAITYLPTPDRGQQPSSSNYPRESNTFLVPPGNSTCSRFHSETSLSLDPDKSRSFPSTPSCSQQRVVSTTHVYFEGDDLATWWPIASGAAGFHVLITRLRRKQLIAGADHIQRTVYLANPISSIYRNGPCKWSHTPNYCNKGEACSVPCSLHSVNSPQERNAKQWLEVFCGHKTVNVPSRGMLSHERGPSWNQGINLAAEGTVNYVGEVTSILLGGAMVRLDGGCVLALLLHMGRAVIPALRTGARLALWHVHPLIMDNGGACSKRLLLGACLHSHVAVVGFAPSCALPPKILPLGSPLRAELDRLPFLLAHRFMSIFMTFQSKFDGILNMQQLLRSRQGPGMVRLYLQESGLPLARLHRNMFEEILGHPDSCRLAQTRHLPSPLKVPSMAEIQLAADALWRSPESILWRQDNGVLWQQPSPKSTYSFTEITDPERPPVVCQVAGSKLGWALVGCLQVSEASGRLQLVDATGSIDVIISGQHIDTWHLSHVYKVTDFQVLVEGMAPPACSPQPEADPPLLLPWGSIYRHSTYSELLPGSDKPMGIHISFRLEDATCLMQMANPVHSFLHVMMESVHGSREDSSTWKRKMTITHGSSCLARDTIKKLPRRCPKRQLQVILVTHKQPLTRKPFAEAQGVPRGSAFKSLVHAVLLPLTINLGEEEQPSSAVPCGSLKVDLSLQGIIAASSLATPSGLDEGGHSEHGTRPLQETPLEVEVQAVSTTAAVGENFPSVPAASQSSQGHQSNLSFGSADSGRVAVASSSHVYFEQGVLQWRDSPCVPRVSSLTAATGKGTQWPREPQDAPGTKSREDGCVGERQQGPLPIKICLRVGAKDVSEEDSAGPTGGCTAGREMLLELSEASAAIHTAVEIGACYLLALPHGLQESPLVVQISPSNPLWSFSFSRSCSFSTGQACDARPTHVTVQASHGTVDLFQKVGAYFKNKFVSPVYTVGEVIDRSQRCSVYSPAPGAPLGEDSQVASYATMPPGGCPGADVAWEFWPAQLADGEVVSFSGALEFVERLHLPSVSGAGHVRGPFSTPPSSVNPEDAKVLPAGQVVADSALGRGSLEALILRVRDTCSSQTVVVRGEVYKHLLPLGLTAGHYLSLRRVLCCNASRRLQMLPTTLLEVSAPPPPSPRGHSRKFPESKSAPQVHSRKRCRSEPGGNQMANVDEEAAGEEAQLPDVTVLESEEREDTADRRAKLHRLDRLHKLGGLDAFSVRARVAVVNWLKVSWTCPLGIPPNAVSNEQSAGSEGDRCHECRAPQNSHAAVISEATVTLDDGFGRAICTAHGMPAGHLLGLWSSQERAGLRVHQRAAGPIVAPGPGVSRPRPSKGLFAKWQHVIPVARRHKLLTLRACPPVALLSWQASGHVPLEVLAGINQLPLRGFEGARLQDFAYEACQQAPKVIFGHLGLDREPWGRSPSGSDMRTHDLRSKAMLLAGVAERSATLGGDIVESHVFLQGQQAVTLARLPACLWVVGVEPVHVAAESAALLNQLSQLLKDAAA